MSDPRGWIREAVAAHEHALLAYARRITGDLETARDAVQDALLALCRADRDEVGGHVRAWLFTVCRHRALDVLRKEGRMTTTDPGGFAALTGDTPSPDAASERREALSRLLSLLERLPPRQQEVLRLKFGAGLSYREISRVTSHSVSYVGVLVHEGMKALRAAAATTPSQS